MLLAAFAACYDVLGSAHPDTPSSSKFLEFVRSEVYVTQPTNLKKGAKAAARKERAAAAPLSLAEATSSTSSPRRGRWSRRRLGGRARRARGRWSRGRWAVLEALAMLELEEVPRGGRRVEGQG
jgi:hypothetical protein